MPRAVQQNVLRRIPAQEPVLCNAFTSSLWDHLPTEMVCVTRAKLGNEFVSQILPLFPYEGCNGMTPSLRRGACLMCMHHFVRNLDATVRPGVVDPCFTTCPVHDPFQRSLLACLEHPVLHYLSLTSSLVCTGRRSGHGRGGARR